MMIDQIKAQHFDDSFELSSLSMCFFVEIVFNSFDRVDLGQRLLEVTLSQKNLIVCLNCRFGVQSAGVEAKLGCGEVLLPFLDFL